MKLPERVSDASMERRELITLAARAVTLGLVAGCVPRARDLTLPVGVTAGGRLDAAAFQAGRRFLKTSFGRIAYFDRGVGDAVLFVHGFPLNGFQWRGAIELLSPYRRCIAPDMMGLGYTEVAPGQSVAPDAQVAMLVRLLDELAVREVDLVANDSGGAVAQLLVTQHPERVRSLLLTNCDVETDSPPPALLPVIEMARAGTYVERWLAPWLADKALARSEKGIGGMTYTFPTCPSDEAIEYYFAPLVRSPRGRAQVHAYAIALEKNALAGIGPALKRCRVPIRILWGTGDTIFAQGNADYLDRTVGNSQGVRRLPGAKLFFPEELPDLVVEEVCRLWRG